MMDKAPLWSSMARCCESPTSRPTAAQTFPRLRLQSGGARRRRRHKAPQSPWKSRLFRAGRAIPTQPPTAPQRLSPPRQPRAPRPDSALRPRRHRTDLFRRVASAPRPKIRRSLLTSRPAARGRSGAPRRRAPRARRRAGVARGPPALACSGCSEPARCGFTPRR